MLGGKFLSDAKPGASTTSNVNNGSKANAIDGITDSLEWDDNFFEKFRFNKHKNDMERSMRNDLRHNTSLKSSMNKVRELQSKMFTKKRRGMPDGSKPVYDLTEEKNQLQCNGNNASVDLTETVAEAEDREEAEFFSKQKQVDLTTEIMPPHKKRRRIIESDSDEEPDEDLPSTSCGQGRDENGLSQEPTQNGYSDPMANFKGFSPSKFYSSTKPSTSRVVIDQSSDEESLIDLTREAANAKPGNRKLLPLPISSKGDDARMATKRRAPGGARSEMLTFFNDSTAKEFVQAIGCSEKMANSLIKLRPFTNTLDLEEKLEETKGVSLNLIDDYREIVEAQRKLDNLLGGCDEASGTLRRTITAGIGSQLGQPEIMNPDLKLKSYQIIGLNWLVTMKNLDLNAILADEMGLGKTVQVIAFLAHLMATNQARGTHVIIVPSSTLDNWIQEFHRFCPSMSVISYYGSMDERDMLRGQILDDRRDDLDVLLTTYSIATSRPEDRDLLYRRMNIQYLILDEAHMVKNCRTSRYTKLMRIPSERRLLLTGTPLQNNLVELISLLHFLLPDFFEQHVTDVDHLLGLFDKKTDDYGNQKIEQAKKILKPFILRRVKSDVLSELPKKIEMIEKCRMSDRQRGIYDSILTDFKELAKSDATKLKGRNGTSMIMELRKAANHPLLNRRYYDDAKLWDLTEILMKEPEQKDSVAALVHEDLTVMNDFEIHLLCRQYKSLDSYCLGDELILDSAKFHKLDEILPQLLESKLKVLLFSQFTMMLDILEKYCALRSYRYIRLDGSTPVIDRQDMISDFNNSDTLFIFLLSTRAGGLGINLTSANNIILHDIDYNPYNDKQAEDRCHRVGQTKDVTVRRLLAENSIDERMYSLAMKKLNLEKQVITTDEEESTAEALLKELLFGDNSAAASN